MDLEVWSDIACPWCYVGKRRLEAALARFDGRDEVGVTWRSFQLEPDAPRDSDIDVLSQLAAKYGISREEALARRAQLVATAAAEGIEMRPELTRAVNTFDAHRVLHLAAASGRQDEAVERFLRAQHCEGARLGDHSTLERLAIEAGLDGAEVRELLASERYGAQVLEDERTAAMLGIHAVPFFVVDRAIGAAGAQPAEILGELLRRAELAPPAQARATSGADT